MNDSSHPPLEAPVPFSGTSNRVVMFVISKSHKSATTEEELYDMTRGNWRIGAKSRETAELAFGIADGIIQSVYQIESWGVSTERYAPEMAKGLDNRSYFSGHRTIATDAWVGMSVRHLAPAPGAANPVRLFLDGVPSPVLPTRATFAQRLSQEPLAQIMFGNKELFHSNMLAWIFNAFPREADEVFQTFTRGTTGSGGRWADREKENLDLVFHWPDKDPLVIENKVFSVPTSDQLDKYAKKVSKWASGPGNMVLLSPTRSSFIDRGYSTRYRDSLGSPLAWEHLSFDRLAELLVLAFDGTEATYEVETVRRYASILQALGGLIDSTRIGDVIEPVFSATGDVDQYLTKQMTSSLSKARAERVAESINTHLGMHGQPATAYSLFSNAMPGVSSFFEVRRGEYEFQAGWQYQGGTFRLALILPHLDGKGPESKNIRAAFARNHPEYFSFDHLDSILDSAGTKLSNNKQGKTEGEFNHFDPDFIYRYKKLPDLSVDQVLKAAVAHAEYLFTLTE